MEKEMVKILAASPLFNGIPDNELAGMLGCLNPKVESFAKSSYIAVEGDEFAGLGILLAGEATVIKENAAGVRNVMTILGPGHMFGEMVAFSARRFWPASVFAQTECMVVFLPPGKITGECEKVCANHTRMINNMLQIVSEKALLLNRKVEYLSIRSMRVKIATYLLEQYKQTGKKTFYIPLKRNDMADFLNVSRTALSREMGRMRDVGLIEFYRSAVKINDLAGLMETVE